MVQPGNKLIDCKSLTSYLQPPCTFLVWHHARELSHICWAFHLHTDNPSHCSNPANALLSSTKLNDPTLSAIHCHVTGPPQACHQTPLELARPFPWAPSPRLLPPRSRLLKARPGWGFRWEGLVCRSRPLAWLRTLRPPLFSERYSTA